MFEQWPAQFARPCRVELTPPRAVTVDLGQVLPPERHRPQRLPMRVRADGLVLSGSTEGMLLAWAITSQGAWLGCVEFTLSTANDYGTIELRQWVPAHALQPR